MRKDVGEGRLKEGRGRGFPFRPQVHARYRPAQRKVPESGESNPAFGRVPAPTLDGCEELARLSQPGRPRCAATPAARRLQRQRVPGLRARFSRASSARERPRTGDPQDAPRRAPRAPPPSPESAPAQPHVAREARCPCAPLPAAAARPRPGAAPPPRCVY